MYSSEVSTAKKADSVANILLGIEYESPLISSGIFERAKYWRVCHFLRGWQFSRSTIPEENERLLAI